MTEKVGPFTKFEDAAEHLRRPFTPEAVKWKIQNLLGAQKDAKGRPDAKTAKGGVIVAYIDARLVIERLNLLTPGWQDGYVQRDGGVMQCGLSVCGLTRYGFGQHGDVKAAESDALKRAGVKFGVGVSLYAITALTYWRAKNDAEAARGNILRPDWSGRLALDDVNRKWLMDVYAKWLEKPRGKSFGDPLDHGDEFGAIDPSDPDTERPEAPAEPEADTDLNNLRQDVQVAYLGIPKTLMPKGKFDALLASATTPDELRGLLAQIEALKEEAVAA